MYEKLKMIDRILLDNRYNLNLFFLGLVPLIFVVSFLISGKLFWAILPLLIFCLIVRVICKHQKFYPTYFELINPLAFKKVNRLNRYFYTDLKKVEIIKNPGFRQSGYVINLLFKNKYRHRIEFSSFQQNRVEGLMQFLAANKVKLMLLGKERLLKELKEVKLKIDASMSEL
jgi:hypothetical protein